MNPELKRKNEDTSGGGGEAKIITSDSEIFALREIQNEDKVAGTSETETSTASCIYKSKGEYHPKSYIFASS